ncbi:MAG: SsrA-binding protein SmpB [Bacteroidetes bacterium]|nr:SsrA-binding protein SmpB [Bacteroidota bacterium]MCZ6694503.1 SsrA-binding protein SmpB [Bacteroidota bacterium]MCZ6899358.1 SsrA-binding protein SmpB [Bacteroidota bacterium]
MAETFSNKINIRNKRATFEYHLLDTYIAGLMLQGSEIKSIRMGKINLRDAYCLFNKEELFVREMHISQYSKGGQYNHEEKRERKLLLKKKELKKIFNKSRDKGITIIPVRIYISNRGLAKLEIAIAKGKKLYDKRKDIQERDAKRELARLNKIKVDGNT